MKDPKTISDIDTFSSFRNECGDIFFDTVLSTQQKEEKLIDICSCQFKFMADRSISIIELIKISKLWDAQILLRPVFESCLKVCYLCLTPNSIRLIRCREYEEILGAINTLKSHDQATKTVAAAGGLFHHTIDAVILCEPQRDELDKRFPKQQRNEVQARWGFSRLIGELDQQFRQIFNSSPFATFLHSYQLSSHIIHADVLGIRAIRASGQLERQIHTVVEASHRQALLSSVAGSAMLCTISLAWATQTNLESALSLTDKFDKLHKMFDC